MGVDSALRLCSCILFLSILADGAVIKSDYSINGNADSLPDDICPCVTRADCPRIFGSEPEDELLGSFSPCRDPDSVRCCGVTTRVSVERSVSSNLPPHPESTVVPPVASETRENFDPRDAAASRQPEESSDDDYFYSYDDDREEAISGLEKKTQQDRRHSDEEKSNTAETARDENMRDNVPPIDTFVSPDRLDRSGVNKHGAEGGVRTITESGLHHGKISSNEKVESVSSSSSTSSSFTSSSSSSASTSEKQTESIVTRGEDGSSSNVGSNAETLPEIEKVKVSSSGSTVASVSKDNELETESQLRGDVADSQLSIVRPAQRSDKDRYDRLQSGSRGSTVFDDHRETSSQRKSEQETKRTSNFEESSSTAHTLESKHRGDAVERGNQEANLQIGTRVGLTGYENHSEVSNERKTVTKESSHVEEKSSSNFESVASTTGEEQSLVRENENVSGGRRRPVAVSQKIRSDPETETAVGSRSETISSAQRGETVSKQRSSSVKKESSNVEESTSSDIRKVVKVNNARSLEDNANLELVAVTPSPVERRRRPIANRGSVAYGQRAQTSSQQRTESARKESSRVEESQESTSSKVRSDRVANNVAYDSKLGIPTVTVRPFQRGGRPLSNRGNVVHGQRSKSSSQVESSSVKKESSNVEESSNIQKITTNANPHVELVLTSWHSVPGAEKQTSNRGQAVVVQDERSESTSRRQSHSSNQESSMTVESSSSDARAQTEAVVEKDAELLIMSDGTSETVGATSSGKRTESSGREESKVVKQESSSLEENHSSNVLSSASITEVSSRNAEETRETSEKVTKESSGNVAEEKTTSHSTVTDADATTSANIQESDVFDDRQKNEKQVSSKAAGSMELRYGNLLPAYIPVLVNAGFLRDRQVSTGAVGLDPFSGVTHTDIWNSNLASDIHPLSCGNVIFGERFVDGRTILCNIPPIRFLGGDAMKINPEKLSGPALLGAIVPDLTQPIRNTVIRNNVESLEAVNSLRANSMASEVRDEESSKTTDVLGNENKRRGPFRSRVAVGAKLTVPQRPRSTMYRGRSRYPNPSAESVPAIAEMDHVEEDRNAFGSRHVSKQSTSTSSSSSLTARSSQESVSSSDSNREIIKSDFDVASTDRYDAAREIEERKSRLYVVPATPVLPNSRQGSSESVEEPGNVRIIEVVDEAPVSRTKISKKILKNLSSGQKLPVKELQVVTLKTSEDNGATVKEAEFVVPDNDSRRRKFFYNRNSRQVREFAPGAIRVVIPAEDLSQAGGLSVIGPIPSGYEDPARSPRESPVPVARWQYGISGIDSQGGVTRGSGDHLFKASPIDPLNFQ